MSFYAAVHYIEYKLAKDVPARHTEKDGGKGDQHAWREQQVNTVSYVAYIAYRHLRVNSNIARYLCAFGKNTGGKPSYDYFTDEDAKDALSLDLKNFKKEINSLYPFS